MPLCTVAMAKAGNAAQARHSGRNDVELPSGDRVMTTMARLATVVAMINASQRLPVKKPRNSANCLSSPYSGMKRCAAQPKPRSLTPPISNSQVQA